MKILSVKISKNLVLIMMSVIVGVIAVSLFVYPNVVQYFKGSNDILEHGNKVDDTVAEEENGNDTIDVPKTEESTTEKVEESEDKTTKEEEKSTSSNSSSSSESSNSSSVPTAAPSAKSAVAAMKIGWNLGNTFDSKTSSTVSYETSLQKKDKYQFFAMYTTKNYTGWDASSYPYISSTTSTATMTWNINSLNSSLSGECGKFGVQIINNSLGSSGTNTISYSITTATFKTQSGKTIILSDLVGTFTKTINNGVTPYVYADLTKYPDLLTSANLIGGTLTITVKINNYPNPGNMNLSKETYFETLWGNSVTTKTTIDNVKSMGFNAVRIPVTYYNHIDANGNIDQAWLARIAQIVNYVLADGMYCIIDVHHDTGSDGWLRADSASYGTSSIKFKVMWNQIANYFKSYDSKLIFEGYNELLNNSNQWNYAGSASYSIANKLNQDFVDVVRATGGNNATRNLLVNTYASSAEANVISGFILPNDSTSGHIIVGVHYYGSGNSSVDAVMANLNATFVSKGFPIIIGEFGTAFSLGTEAYRAQLGSYYVSAAKKYSYITPFWWDDGNYKNEAGAKCSFALYDRVAGSWYYPTLAKSLVNAAN